MLTGLRSIEAQITAMATMWPLMKLMGRDGRSAEWVGPIQPTGVEYQVRVRYTVPHVIERLTMLEAQPRVQILKPILERHADYDEGPVPHVYVCTEEPDLPFLCLFDPYKGEWSPSDLLAETTVPWTASYLLFYEGWLATKRWLGPGRHPTPKERASGGGRAIAKV